METFGALIKAVYKLLDTKFTLPWFGQTSGLRMLILLSLLEMVVYFVNRLLGGSGEEVGEDE